MIYTAISSNNSEYEAALELYNGFKDNINDITHIIFFASTFYKSAKLVEAMNKIFKSISVFGCSAGNEIYSGKIYGTAIVAMAFTRKAIYDIKIDVLTDLDKNEIGIESIEKSISEHFGESFELMNSHRYFGIVLTDHISMKDEKILKQLNDITSISIIGASASDDMKSKQTICYANGKYYEHSSIIAIVKAKCDFQFEIVQHIIPTQKTFVVTKSDIDNRIIYELDGRHAIDVYADAVACYNTKNLSECFSKYFFATVLPDSNLHIRGFAMPFSSSIGENGSLKLACGIKQGTKISICSGGNVVSTSQVMFEIIRNKYENIHGIILWDDYNRYLALSSNEAPKYTKSFRSLPFIGMYSFGESYNRYYNNFMGCMLIFYER